MKTFKYIFSLFALFLLFTASVNAANLAFSENSIENSVGKDHLIQVKSKFGMFFLIDSEIESVFSISQPDTIPLSFDEDKSKTNELLIRSHKLTLTQGSKTKYYGDIFLKNTFAKDIIFPFHSFW